jgi:hypothetical protein
MKGMKENTHPSIKVHNWWGTNIDKSLQNDHMELLHRLESPSSLGFHH